MKTNETISQKTIDRLKNIISFQEQKEIIFITDKDALEYLEDMISVYGSAEAYWEHINNMQE